MDVIGINVHLRAMKLQPGGSVVVRDYGVNDYAMIRFGRGAKLADRFYVRQDGTRAFYFCLGEICYTIISHFLFATLKVLHCF